MLESQLERTLNHNDHEQGYYPQRLLDTASLSTGVQKQMSTNQVGLTD